MPREVSPLNEAEWRTRKNRIDTRLKQNGWNLVKFTPALNLRTLDRTAVEELPTGNGPADYGLFVSGRLLGIIGAKKVTVNPQNVLEQAKRYARGVFDAVGEWNGLRVPFLYDRFTFQSRPSRANRWSCVSRQLSNFNTPEALDARFAHDASAAGNFRAGWADILPKPEEYAALRAA
jgi:type I restriction enzyme R subunit